MPGLEELSLVLIMILGPALCVVIWEMYQEYKICKARRDPNYIINLVRKNIEDADMPAISFGFKPSRIHRNVTKDQTRKDDHTFKTVEEYRNGLD